MCIHLISGQSNRMSACLSIGLQVASDENKMVYNQRCIKIRDDGKQPNTAQATAVDRAKILRNTEDHHRGKKE